MIRNKFNKLIVVICLVVILGCDDSSSKIESYLKSASNYFDQENYEFARLEYRNALQIDNNLVEALYHLALLDEKNKNWPSMFANLSKVVELEPLNVDARLKLGQLQMFLGQLQVAEMQIDEVLELTNDNPKAYALKGALLLKKKDFKGATEMANKALEIEPEHVNAISLKTRVFQLQNNSPSALTTVKEALLVNPNELSLNLLKLQLDIKLKDNASIETDYLELIQRFPEKIEFKLALSKHFLAIGEQDRFLKLIQSVIRKHPADLRPKVLLSDLLIKTDEVKAEETIKRFIVENKNAVEFYLFLARLYIQQMKLEEAKQPLKQIIAVGTDNKASLAAKVLIAKLTLQSGDTSNASILVKEVLTLDANYFDAMLLKGRIELVNGLYDEAITNLQNLVRDFPASDEAMVLLAQAYLKKNAPELADKNFQKALLINPGNFAAIMPVVSGMIRNKDMTLAENVLQKALEVKPDHAGALQTLAQVRLLRKDWVGTQQVADLIETKPKGKGFSKYLGGKILQGQGVLQKAIASYQLALVSNPQLSDALKSMMVCYNALNQSVIMLTYLNEFIQKNPNDPYPLVLKSEVYSKDKKWDDALAVLNKGLDKWPKAIDLYEAIAHIYITKKESQKIIQVYKQGLAIVPENIRLRMFLATAYEREKNYKNALENYEILIKKQPNLDLAVNNLVSLLLDHFLSKENISKAVKLAQRFKNSEQPYFLDTYGWALLQDGKPQQALPVFERASAIMPYVAVFKYHLGVTYFKLNMHEKAISVLEYALSLSATDNLFVEKELTLLLLKQIKERERNT